MSKDLCVSSDSEFLSCDKTVEALMEYLGGDWPEPLHAMMDAGGCGLLSECGLTL